MTDNTDLALWDPWGLVRREQAEIERVHAAAYLVLGPAAQKALDEANSETLEQGGLIYDYLRAVRRKMSAGPRRVITPEQLHDFGIGYAASREGNN